MDISEIKPGEKELQSQIDDIKLAIAEDLKLINTGVVDKLKILSLDNALYKRVFDVIKLVSTKSQKTDSIDNEDIEVTGKVTKEEKKSKFTIPKGGNIYEHVVEDIKKNGRTNIRHI